ncbi:phosphoribosylanthranilate isomerase [Candidatus Thiosymbion oneisti]|uniref:phosphoribosylanthranilate isomerase n=1 Tax=Candidatus Thiosymbion oneisti TaxID=589554 RepID=UPI000B2B71A9|nr:phosphoribosylanthranilate isomerase [Candidatus Thiosymbion oneisti]
MERTIQIAGIKNLMEAKMLVDSGVEWLGFPLRLDVNTPDLTERQAAEVIRSLGSKTRAVIITYLNGAREILDFTGTLGTPYLQLHGPIKVHQLHLLRNSGKRLFIIKSLVVGESNKDQLVKGLQMYPPYVDAFITDTFDPHTGTRGATGKTHDWSISGKIVEMSPRPVILAGGLNHLNVRDAILAVKPAGVDSHTGVENKDGDKDPKLVRAFVSAAKSAFEEI